jgi:hypothetical protein
MPSTFVTRAIEADQPFVTVADSEEQNLPADSAPTQLIAHQSHEVALPVFDRDVVRSRFAFLVGGRS